MAKKEVNYWLKRFQDSGVIRIGHVVMTNGFHTKEYAFFPALFMTKHRLLHEVLVELAKLAGHETMFNPKVVFVGVGKGAWFPGFLSYRCSREQVDHDFVDVSRSKSTGTLKLTEEQRLLVQDHQTVIIDDVFVTGATFAAVKEIIEKAGGYLVDMIAVLNRSEQPIPSPDGAFSIKSLVHAPMDAWPKEACPLCAAGKPYTIEVGRGADEFHLHGHPVAVSTSS